MSIFGTKSQNDLPFKEGEYAATMLRMDWKDTKAGDPMMVVEFVTTECRRIGKAMFPQVNAFFEDEAKQACQVLLGVAEGFGASIKGPGHIHHNAMRQIRIGEMGGGMTDRLVWIESLWQAAGFKATAFADIHQLVWEKFICNVMCSAPSVAFDCTIGELFSDEDRRIVALGCMLEAYEIGLAKNIAFSFDDAVAYGVKFAADMPHASPSMRLDHLAGKRSEIDAINGMVPVLGREVGVKTPYNDTLVALVRAREANFA